MKVYWTDTAERNLDAIYGYIAQNSPEHAQRMVVRLKQRLLQVSEFPSSGRKVRGLAMEQIREVIEGPYRIIYRIKPDQIDVLGVIHEARDLLR